MQLSVTNHTLEWRTWSTRKHLRGRSANDLPFFIALIYDGRWTITRKNYINNIRGDIFVIQKF